MADARTPLESPWPSMSHEERDIVLNAVSALVEHEGFVIVACPVGERRVVDRTPQPCPECNGKGRLEADTPPRSMLGGDPCQTCGGRGTVDSDRVLAVEADGLGGVIATNGHGGCSQLDTFGRCSIYQDRPLICRLYGAVPSLACEHGCSPSMGDDEARVLMQRMRQA